MDVAECADDAAGYRRRTNGQVTDPGLPVDPLRGGSFGSGGWHVQGVHENPLTTPAVGRDRDPNLWTLFPRARPAARRPFCFDHTQVSILDRRGAHVGQKGRGQRITERIAAQAPSKGSDVGTEGESDLPLIHRDERRRNGQPRSPTRKEPRVNIPGESGLGRAPRPPARSRQVRPGHVEASRKSHARSVGQVVDRIVCVAHHAETVSGLEQLGREQSQRDGGQSLIPGRHVGKLQQEVGGERRRNVAAVRQNQSVLEPPLHHQGDHADEDQHQIVKTCSADHFFEALAGEGSGRLQAIIALACPAPPGLSAFPNGTDLWPTVAS